MRARTLLPSSKSCEEIRRSSIPNSILFYFQKIQIRDNRKILLETILKLLRANHDRTRETYVFPT